MNGSIQLFTNYMTRHTLQKLDQDLGNLTSNNLTHQTITSIFQQAIGNTSVRDTRFEEFQKAFASYINNLAEKINLQFNLDQIYFFNTPLSEKQFSIFKNYFQNIKRSQIFENVEYQNIHIFFTALLMFELNQRQESIIGLTSNSLVRTMVVGGSDFARTLITAWIEGNTAPFAEIEKTASEFIDNYITAPDNKKKEIEQKLFKKDIADSLTLLLYFMSAVGQQEASQSQERPSWWYLTAISLSKWQEEQEKQKTKANKEQSAKGEKQNKA
ncbi:MAG: hypothetical protein QXT25_00175 [Candidatus Anstonellaceae archaeon]